MSAIKKHTETTALNSLKKKHDVKIDTANKIIYVNVSDKKKNDLGNGSHGKISFLENILNYRVIKTTKF